MSLDIDSPDFGLKILGNMGFDVNNYVGKGVFGEVYCCRDSSRMIALKVPRVPSLNSDYYFEDKRKKFKLNIEHIRREHLGYVRAHQIPGVPSGSEIIESPVRIFGEMFHILKRNFVVGTSKRGEKISRTEEALRKTIMQCHQAGMAELDICSRNVIATKRRPYLIDFGCSVFLEDVGREDFYRGVEKDFQALRNLAIERVLPEV